MKLGFETVGRGSIVGGRAVDHTRSIVLSPSFFPPPLSDPRLGQLLRVLFKTEIEESGAKYG